MVGGALPKHATPADSTLHIDSELGFSVVMSDKIRLASPSAMGDLQVLPVQTRSMFWLIPSTFGRLFIKILPFKVVISRFSLIY